MYIFEVKTTLNWKKPSTPVNIVGLINVYCFDGVSRSIARCRKLSENFAVDKRLFSSCVNKSSNVDGVFEVHVHEKSV